jgi:hypothetical protein
VGSSLQRFAYVKFPRTTNIEKNRDSPGIFLPISQQETQMDFAERGEKE